jgi:protocatechuate 3,4-dioxygenase beta subunit
MRLQVGFVMCVQAASAFAQQTATATDPKDLAVVEGRVLDTAGNPLRKTILTLRADGTKPGEEPTSYAATSDADGKFIFDGVEPGRYMLLGQHAGYLHSTYGGKRSGSSGTVLTLTVGQHMTEIKFPLTPQSSISGRILDQDGDPVAYAQIQVLRNTYNNGKRQLLPFGYAQIDEKGQFTCKNLSAGRYYLLATVQRTMPFGTIRKTRGQANSEKPEEQSIPTYYPGVLEASSSTAIEVEAGKEMQGFEIRLRKSAVFGVKGTVSGSIPSDMERRVRVFVTRYQDYYFNDFGNSVMVGKDGTFEMSGIAPGSYDLLAVGTGGMARILARQPIQVGNQNVDGVTLVAQPPGSISGSLKVEPASAQADTDLSTVRISLNALNGAAFNFPNAMAKNDGTFTLDNVAQEKYSLNVLGNPAGTYLKAARIGDLDALANDLDFTGGMSGGTLDILLSNAAGEIDGTVQNDRQQPAPGSVVTLIPDPADSKLYYRYKVTTTDQNGQFVLKGLSPGEYRLYAWEDLETGNQYDPDFMKPLEGLGTKVTVEENGKQALNLTQISTAQVEKAK